MTEKNCIRSKNARKNYSKLPTFLYRNFFPENLFQATFQQAHTTFVNKNGTLTRELSYRNSPNTLGLVAFCLIFGSIANSLGEKGEVIRVFFSTVFDILLNITTKVMWLSGLGVCSIITGKLLQIGDLPEVVSQLALFMCCVIFGVFLHQLVLMPAIYFFFIRKNPYTFYLSLMDAWVTAFAVASSYVYRIAFLIVVLSVIRITATELIEMEFFIRIILISTLKKGISSHFYLLNF